MGARRFPPPGTVEETDACFIVPTPLGRRWTYVYFEEESGRGVAAKQLTRDEAPGTAANIAKLPELLRRSSSSRSPLPVGALSAGVRAITSVGAPCVCRSARWGCDWAGGAAKPCARTAPSTRVLAGLAGLGTYFLASPGCSRELALLAFGKLAERVDLIAFVETGAGDVVEDGHLLGASYIAGDGAPPFAGLYGDVGHERFQVLILRT